MVELLLAKGAYVDPIGPVGTPLHTAATNRQDSTMRILLDHNADVSSNTYHFHDTTREPNSIIRLL